MKKLSTGLKFAAVMSALLVAGLVPRVPAVTLALPTVSSTTAQTQASLVDAAQATASIGFSFALHGGLRFAGAVQAWRRGRTPGSQMESVRVPVAPRMVAGAGSEQQARSTPGGKLEDEGAEAPPGLRLRAIQDAVAAQHDAEVVG